MPHDAERKPTDYAVVAVERAIDIVAALTRTGPATLTRVAAEAGYTRVTVFRALHTLQGRGLVMQDGKRGRWRLGASWLGVARAAENQRALAYAVAPQMRALAQQCQEVVQLAVRDGQESQLAAVETGDRDSRTTAAVGSRAPLHAGPGRLLLAYAPQAVQRSVLISRLPRLTPETRIDPAWITAELPRIRARGWLIATEEVQEGIVTVSCGIPDQSGDVVAALTIHAPTIRARPPRPHTLLTPLLATAAEITKALSVFARHEP